jgi:hypothetical protein
MVWEIEVEIVTNQEIFEAQRETEKELAEIEQRIPFAANVATEDYYKERKLKLQGLASCYKILQDWG